MKTIKIISLVLATGLISISFIFFSNSLYLAFPKGEDGGTVIKWYTFQEAVELNKKEKRKIFIDVYTDWCGWCKVMDKNTFSHPVIAKYMNEKYYPVKLNAEMKDTIIFNNHTFRNPNPQVLRSTHELAASLLNNKLSYPTTVYLDENFNMLTQVPGYQTPDRMEPIMKYFGNNAYPAIKWEDYQRTFKGEITVPPQPLPQTSPSQH